MSGQRTSQQDKSASPTNQEASTTHTGLVHINPLYRIHTTSAMQLFEVRAPRLSQDQKLISVKPHSPR
jgi:hypothetical protein